MSRWFLVLFTTLVLCTNGLAQNSGLKGLARIDSLEAVSQTLSGEKKVDLLNAMALECASYDERRSNTFTVEALQLSEKLNYGKGKALALIYRALYEQSVGDQLLSLELYNEGISLAGKLKLKEIEGYGLVKQANFLVIRGDMQTASDLYNRAYVLLKDSDLLFELSILYKEWSKFYGVRGEREKQLDLLKQSLELRQKINRANLLADIYLHLADYYMNELNYDQVYYYLQQIEKLQATHGQSPSIENSLKFSKASLLLKQANYQEALTLLNDVKSYYKNNDMWYEYVTTQYEIAYIFADVGNYELSLNNAYDGLKIAEANGYTYEQAKLLWQLGWVYPYLKQYGLAKDFAYKSLLLAKKNQYKVLEGTNYNLLGVIFYDNRVYDSSLYYLGQALTIREELNDPLRIASTLNNLGYLMFAQGKYREAIAYQLQSLTLETKNKNAIGIAWCNLALGQIYFAIRDYSKAERHLAVAEENAKKVQSTQALHDVYLEMAKLTEIEGKKDRSLEYYKLHIKLKDSLYNTSLTNRVASLQNEYTLLQKNQQIELLNKDNELKEAALTVQRSKVQQQRLIILLGAVIFILIAIISYFFYRNYMKVRALNFAIQEKNEEIQAQSEELQLSNQTIAKINEELEDTVELRTRELKQAYKELDTFFYRSSHDFRRPLTTFMGLAEVAKITVKDENAIHLFEKVNQTARNLDKMLVKLQSVSDVGSVELIYKEIYIEEIFSAAIDVYSGEIKERNIKVITDVSVPETFSSYPALIKVVIENLLENAIMFSDHNSTVRLFAYTNKGGLTIRVEDDGWGIDEQYIEQIFDMYFRAHERSKGNGLGLYIVKKIVGKLGGQVSLKSVVTKGTQVEVFLPHQAKSGVSV